MYLSDPFSTKNFTAIVPSHVFYKMREFVLTRRDLETKVSFDYVYDCSEVRVSKDLYFAATITYLFVFAAVLSVTSFKHCRLGLSVDEEDEDEVQADYLKRCMSKMMLALLFLALVKAFLNMSYLSYCPWKLETEKRANFTMQTGHFSKTLTDTSLTYLTFMLAIGFSVIKLDISLIEIKFVFSLTAFKFMFGQVFGTLGTFQGVVSVLIVMMIVIDFLSLVVMLSFIFHTLRKIALCLSLM